ncbi:choice-of-anchor Q domain-containing protein [Arsenicibacter rosenii]|uniref:Right handed beta helix domain-containing protein n=1 Tax=Arsenicibacter rosenii TaxID=1750698 RepID=A0A1S2VNZ3_9BACT|nr:choice-of-anchor Q domain-containing protein [Arsenicibacter rosenii]OIN60491.1 hypothetical protein BLX24_06640 [Arsenicibacter rosenii]
MSPFYNLDLFNRILKGAICSLLLSLPAYNATVAQTIRYVKPNGTGDGSTWANASGNLQAMINASNTDEQVWVAAGTYKPTADPANRSASFSMKNGVTIYGGFAGTGNPTMAERNPTGFATVLSGEIGDPGTTNDNSFHVIFNPAGIDNSAVLDGFVITGGNASAANAPDCNGGGVYNNGNGNSKYCSPGFRYCLFVGNRARAYGGALYNTGGNGTSSPVLSNCNFRNNLAGDSGGAAYNNGSYSGNSHPVFTNCSFQTNSAGNAGGAIFSDGRVYGSSNPVLTNCSFQDNASDNAGGALYNFASTFGNSNPVLTNCSFRNNPAVNTGGAFFNNAELGGNSSPVLTNCSFQGNSAGSSGGAMYNYASVNGNARPVLINCVLFGNGDEKTFANDGGGVTATYSLFDNTVAGNTYSSDPTNLTTAASPFASPASVALAPCSPAIDAGDNSAPGLSGITVDLAGNPRIKGEQVDLGAVEFQILPPGAIFSLSADESGCPVRLTAQGTGTSFVFTGPGNVLPGNALPETYVFSNVYRTGGTYTLQAPGVKQSGTYTLTATYVYSCGTSAPVTQTVTVGRRCP